MVCYFSEVLRARIEALEGMCTTPPPPALEDRLNASKLEEKIAALEEKLILLCNTFLIWLRYWRWLTWSEEKEGEENRSWYKLAGIRMAGPQKRNTPWEQQGQDQPHSAVPPTLRGTTRVDLAQPLPNPDPSFPECPVPLLIILLEATRTLLRQIPDSKHGEGNMIPREWNRLAIIVYSPCSSV